MQEIIFQKVTTDDVDEYLRLEKMESDNKLYSSVINREEAIQEIKDNEIYFIKLDNKIIGQTEYQIKTADEAYLGGLILEKQYRRQGFGRKAVEFRLNKIGARKRIWLTTHPENFKIINLYTSLGFKIEERKENYYGDGEPRIIMSLLNN